MERRKLWVVEFRHKDGWKPSHHVTAFDINRHALLKVAAKDMPESGIKSRLALYVRKGR